MSAKAYLVIHLDTSVKPPKVIGADIYSESAAQLTGAIGRTRYAFDVISAQGDNFPEAIRNLWDARDWYRGALDWAFDMVPKRAG